MTCQTKYKQNKSTNYMKIINSKPFLSMLSILKNISSVVVFFLRIKFAYTKRVYQYNPIIFIGKFISKDGGTLRID